MTHNTREEEVLAEFDERFVTALSTEYKTRIREWIKDTLHQQLQKTREEEVEEWQRLADSAEMLWVCLANVSEGDWTKQTPEWQKAAIRWRDNYFGVVAKKDHSELDQAPESSRKAPELQGL